MKADMKIAPDIKYKITPPRLARVLDRNHLTEFIHENIQQKSVLILGQAAQGKSSLAASYLEKTDLTWAWINVDHQDSDPARLFQSLTQAFFDATKSSQLKEILEYPGISMGIREERLLYREWIQALTKQISEPFLLVLDGLDRLAPEARSYKLIEVMLETLPPTVQLILTSREMPPIEAQQLTVSQKLKVLENEDLAFTEVETGSFFQQIRKTPMAPWEIREAHRVTEGWIGGLVLLSDKFSRLSNNQRKDLLSGSELSRFKEDAFRYLEEEIFSSLPSNLQDLLVKAALFDTIDPTFLGQLLNVSNAETIFLALSQKNLFVQLANSQGNRQVFRYHQLFRDFLRRKFEIGTEDQEKRQILTKAGKLFLEKENEEEALRYFLEAQNYDLALPLFERIGLLFLKSGQLTELSKTMSAFPEPLIQKSPWLLSYSAMANRFSHATENLKTLDQALSLFEDKHETRGQLLALAYLIEASVIAGHDHTPLAELLKKAEALLTGMSDDRYLYERATLWFLVGFGTAIRGGNPRKGSRACWNASVLAAQTGDKILQTQALIQSMQALSWLGEFSLCEQLRHKIESLIEDLGNPALEATYLIVLAALLGGRGCSDEAKRLILEAQEKVTSHGLIYLYPQTLVYELLFGPLEGKYNEAEVVGEQLSQFASSMNAFFLKGIARFFLGLNAYHQGRLEKAMNQVTEAAKVFSLKNARSEFHIHWTALVKGLLVTHMERGESLSSQFEDAVCYYQHTSNHIFLVHARFIQALLFHKKGRKGEALKKLDQGFHMVKDKGYEHFFFLSWADFTRICILAIEFKSSEGIACAEQFLKTRLSSWALPELLKLDNHPDHWVRKKVFEIRKSIHRSAVPVIHVAALGGLWISKEDGPVPESAWEGNQPKRLLKAILSRGSRNIQKDVLIEDLWPESDPETVTKNFKVTLHRLRKALEPDMDQTYGSSYVHLKDNLVFLDDKRIKIDVDGFLESFESGREKERQGDIDAAVKWYESAAKFYVGDFLADELYAPWAEWRRRKLQDEYLSMLFRWAKLHESNQETQKAISIYERITIIDPYREDAYQKLMDLHALMGRKNQVTRVYEICKKALWEGLETKPDHRTRTIYQQIVR